jgi:hypothetical protein
MRSKLIFISLIAILLFPRMSFSWGESKHPISELLIHHVCIDSNYLFCGSHAHWGTNDFGVFLFDRRTETWTNYPDVGVSDRRFDPITDFEAQDDWISVEFYSGIIHRFNCEDRSHEIISNRKRKESFPLGYQIKVEGTEYWIDRDSVVVVEDNDTTSYRPASQDIPEPTGIQPVPKVLTPIFATPLVHQNKMYLPYDLGLAVVTTYTDGIAVFDLVEKTFEFHTSELLRGTVTDHFVYDSLIVFSTTTFWYEGNASPAVGFIAFDPASATFSNLKGLPLPDEPLAIFQVAQDQREYWIGTDKGVFRIDKKTNKTTHYQIAKGIVAKDGSEVRAQGYLVTKLDKGWEVELLAVLNAWCEIKSPRHVSGFVEGKYIAGVTLQKDSHDHICSFRPLHGEERIPVRVSADPEAEIMVYLDANSLKDYEYKMVAKVAKQGQPTWYKIKLPTAWVNMDDLVFQLGEVE